MLSSGQKKEMEEILASVNKDLPEFNHVQNDIEELEEDLRLIQALLLFLNNEKTAVKLTACLPKGQELVYWIDQNASARAMLINERICILSQLENLKNRNKNE